MTRILYISNIAKKIGSFSMCAIDAAKKNDFEFFCAANWSSAEKGQIEHDEQQYGIKIFDVPMARSPFSFHNFKAYKQLKKIVKENNIDIIHCNTPTGGLLGRLVGKKCKVKKVIYQAHGFHFFKGASFINWMIYYPIEKLLAKKTDILITINKEDYELANKKMHLKKGGFVEYIPGVGVDASQYKLDEYKRLETRKELNLANADIVVISSGDLIKRKNYQTAIEAIARANDDKIHYFICGVGPLENDLKDLSKKLNKENNIHFLGYRSDIVNLLKAADIFLFTSSQEGLSRSLMEAMASGLPCVASSIRGNVDLIEDNVNGYLLNYKDIGGFSSKINLLADNPELRKTMGKANIKAIEKFNCETVLNDMSEIYKKANS